MKRFALPVCAAAALAAGSLVPAHAAEHGWYVGTGIGYSKGALGNNTIDSAVSTASPGSTVTSISKDQNSVMYQLFLGYSFTSFLALEANAFRLGEFSFNTTTSPSGTVDGSLSMWGGSMDVLGIIPLKSWRIYGRAGAILVHSTASYTGTGVTMASEDATKWGWKAGGGIGYEFDSGVAFRAEYNYYNVETALGGHVNTQVVSGTALYRFK
jgi:opacity protein-like surface antigen